MDAKVKELLQELPELEEKLGHPDVFNDQKQYKELTQRHAYLSQVRAASEKVDQVKQELKDNQELLRTAEDPELIEMARLEVEEQETLLPQLEAKLHLILVPPDPLDHANTILEFRAGTGGDEAALFVADCIRMYKFFAEARGWKYEILSATPSDIGGFKECVMVFSGENVHRYLQFEGGTHRVQRVPETETQGRIHTSAITVAVLHEPDESEKVQIDETELRVDTYRSSGAGGQHVNTTDSAVRLTHLPTGIVVCCQDERSQQKNKARAMRILEAKIAEEEMRKQQEEIASSRSQQVGSGDRSERIRTYNFPQNRVTDHRIGLTEYHLDKVMTGELDRFAEALVAHFCS